MLAFRGVGDKPGALSEEIFHLFKGQPFRFRKHGPKENGIREIADLYEGYQ